MSYSYEYPRPALTVDCALVTREGATADGQGGKILLIRRDKPPSEGAWALPGGFVEVDETLEHAACRELREETGVHIEHAEQLHVYDAVHRDPRERILSVLHLAFVDVTPAVQAADDAREAAWHSLDALPELAFDHAAMLARVRAHIAARASFAKK